MTTDSIQKYTKQIANANPTQIIVYVYEIAEIYLEDAIEAYKNDDMSSFDINVKRASKCVNDLINALDMNYEISHALLDVYMFINRELSIAVIKRDVDMLIKLEAMLAKLKKSFEQLAEQDNSGAVMGNAQEVYAGLTYGRGTLNESTISQSNRGFTV